MGLLLDLSENIHCFLTQMPKGLCGGVNVAGQGRLSLCPSCESKGCKFIENTRIGIEGWAGTEGEDWA
jgi:hypothetical protein